MKIYKQFFNEELYSDLCEYAYRSRYKKVQDGIYNFRGVNVEGLLRSRVQDAFLKYGLTGKLDVLRIQRIDANFKVATNFHTHDQFLIENVVCFLNDEFKGGEFEYMDYNIKMIKPIPNMALIFPPDIPHRVNLVEGGIRYTLVAFLEESSYLKKQETLI